MRRAKIVCTLGPASDTPERIRALMEAGMDVARLNFSHGDHAYHAGLLQRVREAARVLDRPIAVLQDLAGPKLRIGLLEDHQPVRLEPGARVALVMDSAPGNAARLPTSFDLSPHLHSGDAVLLADGAFELRVLQTCAGGVECEVVTGGLLGERKGINLPGGGLEIPALSEKDFADLEFGLEQGLDAIALSFIRSARDLRLLRERMRYWAGRHQGRGLDTAVVAKLEKPQALEHLDEILAAADGVMVARGDLGVELPLEQVPAIQKNIIRAARRRRMPVITATQMLVSMTRQPRPTRAEASDVVNAVLDGSDALMLSEETASGEYPVEAVRVLERLIVEAEKLAPALAPAMPSGSIPEAIAAAAAQAAAALPLDAIAAFTQTGSTARLLSGYRPPCPIYALTPNPRTRDRMALYWGVTPLSLPEIASTDEMITRAEARLLAAGCLAPGAAFALVAGAPYGVPGRTNLMKILKAEAAGRGTEADN